MKILPRKQDVQRQQILERKTDIDEGAKLARKIDDLRRVHSNEQRDLELFRTGSIQEVKRQINDILKKRDVLLLEVDKLEEVRDALRVKLTEFIKK